MEILKFNNDLEKKIINDLNLKDKEVYTFAIMKDSKLIAAAIDSKKNYSFDTLFELACVSKLYVAIAIMRLVEKSLIGLDVPVYKYINRFKMKDIRYKKITVRMLLTYSAGFQSDTYKNKMFEYPKKFDKEELYNSLSEEYLRFDPGKFSIYSNTCYELLTALIEEITNENYLDYIDNYLSIIKISIDVRKKKLSDYYYDENYGRICWNLGGAGALVSNAIDLVKFANIFVESREILSNESLEEMSKMHANKYLLSAYNPARGYGLGWDSVNAEKTYEDKILIKTGRLLSASTAVCVIPKYKIAVALIVSNDCVKFSKMSSTLKDLLKIVLDNIYEEFNIKKRMINNEKIVSENKINNIPNYLKGVYYSLTDIYNIKIKDKYIIIYKYFENKWIKYKIIKSLIKMHEYLQSVENNICFERKNNATFLIINGEAIAQKEDEYKINSKYWLNKIGEKFIATDLCQKIKWEYTNISFKINQIKSNECLILDFINSNVKMPFIGIDKSNTFSFLNIPNDNIREAYIPVERIINNRRYMHFKEYNYINVNDIEELKEDIVRIKYNKNKIYRILPTQKKIFSSEKEFDVIILDEDLKIVEKYTNSNRINLNGKYISFISDKDIEIKLKIN